MIGEWPVQFLPPRNALEEDALAAALEVDLDGVRTWVLPAEYLVAIALQVGRVKDHVRIIQFIEQRAVDLQLLGSILERHGLTSKWEEFQRKYVEG